MEQDMMSPGRTALVIGSNGFIAGHVIAALRAAGWHVLRGVRLAAQPLAIDERRADLARMHAPGEWAEALVGVDVVVNAAGILRESGAQTFEAIHVTGPLALARACMQAGVRRFVQISALGVPEDGDFIASKHRFDAALMQLPLSCVILRPSVVYSASGSYGGTSLLRALAAAPGGVLVPGRGGWRLQPLDAGDLGVLVHRMARVDVRCIFDVGGPEVMSLAVYLRAWRAWLRLPGDRAMHVPEGMVRVAVALGELGGRGPMGRTMWRMLRRGNVAAPADAARLQDLVDYRPRSLSQALAACPSQVQDRWHARLVPLVPVLIIALGALWLLSAWVGFTADATDIDSMMRGTALVHAEPVAMARGAAAVDLALGAWLLSGWKPRLCLGLMMASVASYTVVLGLLVPGLWLDAFGGLAKNLVVLPALAMLWVLVDRR